MAGASMNDIKARIKSVSGTMQITKAMELVATSKLRRARERLENSRPYYEVLLSAVTALDAVLDRDESVFSKRREVKRTLYIVIAGDRGLAGAYNSNVFKLYEKLSEETDSACIPIGKKALEYCRRRDKEIFTAALGVAADCGVGDCLAIAGELSAAYARGEFDRVVIVYTKFISMLSQLPAYEEILPFTPGESDTGADIDPIIECENIEEMLFKIIPEYIGGVIYSALCEASAAEQGARRSSMNSANKNAEEMISDLTLKFNRARQAVITQEITEIVSGAEAL